MSDAELLRCVDTTPGLRTAIAIAYQDSIEGLRTAANGEDDGLLSKLTFDFLRTGGANMTPDGRADFIEAALDQFRGLPFHLVVEQLRLAPRSVRGSWELIPWVCDRIEKSWEVRKKHYRSLATVVERLEKL